MCCGIAAALDILKIMRTLTRFFTAISLLSLLVGCHKSEPSTPDNPVSPEVDTKIAINRAVNIFAKNFFNQYYLWTKECSSNLDKWKDSGDPFEGYENYKYYADRWGFVTDDYNSMTQAFEGVSTTPGMTGYFTSYYDTLAFVPKIVYKDTPAAKAGIKRGDVFTGFDGKRIMCKGGVLSPGAEEEMYAIYNKMQTGTVVLRYAETQKTVSVTAKETYEDPIVCHKVFDFGGKKVGYLFYDAFVMDSVNPILQVFREFESEGVSELILDLRYNGGGDVLAEEVIASAIAPKAEVDAKSVFTTKVYNTELNKYYKEKNPDELASHFSRTFEETIAGRKYLFDITDINLDIKKMYVIYTGSSASASEALVVGLGPYLDIELFGEQSYGKYCSCGLLSGKAWYDAYKEELTDEQYKAGIKYASNWGCYVTMARFADKNGVTGNYPNGFSIETENQVADAWSQPYQFGDPQEQMLAKVLVNAGYIEASGTKAAATSEPKIFLDTKMESMPVWGLEIHRLETLDIPFGGAI